MWKLLKKDLLRLRTHPGGFILISLAPLIAAFFMLSVFGGNGKNVTPNVTLVIEDRDDSFASRLISQAFTADQLQDMFTVQYTEDARAVIENDKASAGIIIPENFQQDILAQKPVELALIKNPGQTFGPKIAEETLNIMTEGLDRILRLAETPIAELQKSFQNDQPPTQEEFGTIAYGFYNTFSKLVENFVDTKLELEEKDVSSKGNNESGLIFNFILCGLSVMFLIMTTNSLANDYLQERTRFTMQRIITSPIGRTKYIIAKHLYLLITTSISYFLIWIIAFISQGSSPARPLTFLLVSLLIINASVAFINLFYAFIKSQAQANAMMPAVTIVFSALGGAMMPLQNLPPIIHKIAVISPVFWGTDALQKLLINNQTLWDLKIHLTVLACIGIVFSIITIQLQRRRLAA